MRQLQFLVLLCCFTSSFSQTTSVKDDAASSYYASVYSFIENNQNQNIPDSVKQTQLFNKLKPIIQAHPKDPFCFMLIRLGINLSYSQIETLISLVDSSILKAPEKAWADITLLQVSVAETGKAFPSLTLVDTSGNALQITEFKGKVVLIDVWSSWCGPCREQIPDLIKIYKRYKNKGFEIIGISIDSDKEKWLEAIKKDDQSWKAYSELSIWENNKFAQSFHIKAIPANYLIDENGILVGQDLSPESLNIWLRQHK